MISSKTQKNAIGPLAPCVKLVSSISHLELYHIYVTQRTESLYHILSFYQEAP